MTGFDRCIVDIEWNDKIDLNTKFDLNREGDNKIGGRCRNVQSS